MELQNAADKAKAVEAEAVEVEAAETAAEAAATAEAAEAAATAKVAEATATATGSGQSPMMTDPASFDFEKWEKCMTQVLHEMPQELLTESDKQGEPVLRAEIADYLYRSRGVVCNQNQVIISAGAQQLFNHLARILKLMGIEHVCTEEPGYTPVRSILRDWGFSISNIPVKDDGLAIEKLPTNIRTAAYVCPQNQFPTGAFMPVSNRYLLLDWAEENDSLIIEDDYNSTLSNADETAPTLQGLDGGERVVYMGTFSPTLFPAVRISYMVLPEDMAKLFSRIKDEYDQTCSKTEQLTLARFMHEGFYQDNLNRVRTLYAEKLQIVLEAINACDPNGSFITVENTQSGVNVMLKIDTHARTICLGTSGEERSEEIRLEMTDRMIASAADLGVKVRGVSQLNSNGQIYLTLSYDQIPSGQLSETVKELIQTFKSVIMMGGLDIPSVYEVIRLMNGRPQFLPEHFARLEGSLGAIGKTVPFTYETLEHSITDLATEGRIKDHNLKLEVDISGHGVLYMNPTHYPSPKQYAEGVRTGLFEGERKNPNIKMMDQALRDATNAAIRERSLYEVILVDRNGQITEGSRSNVFFIKGGEVYTSPLHQVLPGITRGKIIEILNGKGITVHEEPITASDIASFDAAFISGTSPKVLPIAQMEDASYDVKDPLLRNLMNWYDQTLD